MTDEVAIITPAKKEPEILNDSSLIHLARWIAQENMDFLILGMMLNIPTTSLVTISTSVSEDDELQEEQKKTVVAERSILLWKKMTSDVKTKDRVRYLEKALKEMGKVDIADLVMEKHSQNQEFTPDCFQ